MSYFVSDSWDTFPAGSGFTIAAPAGIQNGDLLILGYYNGSINLGPTSGAHTSSGWTFTDNIWYKEANNEPSSWTFTGTVNPQWEEVVVMVTAWRIPFDGLSVQDLAVDTHTNPSSYSDFTATFDTLNIHPALVVTLGVGYIGRPGWVTPPGPEVLSEPIVTFNDSTVVATAPSIMPSTGTDDPGGAGHDDVASEFYVTETVVTGSTECGDLFDDLRTDLPEETVTISDPDAHFGTILSFPWELRCLMVRVAVFYELPPADFEPVPDTGCAPLEVTFTNLSDAIYDCFWWWVDLDHESEPTYTSYEPVHTYIGANPVADDYLASLEAFSATANQYWATFPKSIFVENCQIPYWGILTHGVP